MHPVKSFLVRMLPPGAIMHLQALDHYLNGERELRLLKTVVPRNRTAIDAGANIGTYSYFLRKLATRVTAYEPNPVLAERLKNVMPTVQVRNVALSDTNGAVILRIPVDEEGEYCHELGAVSQNFSGATKDYSVECVTIDSEHIEDVGFVKIDVEQHEREVLRGGLSTIKRCRPIVLIEVYPLKYNRGLFEEFAFLLENDYCAWFWFRGTWHHCRNFNQHLYAAPENFGLCDKFMGNNLFFFPSEHPLAALGPAGRN